ncbi:MAG: SMP-30/gluconolactonase/LRE family protein [Flavobacteriaceae bacterium]|jgi:gluconolactonase|nr:SMP-30/gluconolactonase/LRE family protein [Flavobacteriaceae bacterium]MBT6127502.1 SMP-30/gluconolactonase/LRE family protein [Flavobacteriaceae bacterium]
MKLKIIPLFAICFVTYLAAQEKRTLGSVERLLPEIDQYVAPGAEIEILAEGFGWSEGPVWVDRLDAVIFSDVPANKAYKWDEKDGLSVFLDPSGYTGIAPRGKKGGLNAENRDESGSNGLVLDANGVLTICMHGDRRVARLDDWDKKSFTTIIGKYQGKYFNSPNDLVFAKNGDLYFTDPPYGLKKGDKDPLKELDFNGVFKLTPSGSLSLIIDNLTRPNGVAISIDQKTLYVAVSDPKDRRIMAYDIQPNGVENGRVFFNDDALRKEDRGNFDGLKIHPSGTIFSTGPGGVLIITPEGKHLGTIRTQEKTANCAFDSKHEYLYMTTHMYLTRIKL